MKLTKIAGIECTDKVTCPAAHRTDRGTVIVIGKKIDDHDGTAAVAGLPVGDDEYAVEIPEAMWPA